MALSWNPTSKIKHSGFTSHICVNKNFDLCFWSPCLSVCGSGWPCLEEVLWKSASRWWRVYWLVNQAPGVSTWQDGDPSRPSYWHTELICSAESIQANWNYHCAASHVSALFVWLLLVLCVFVYVFMEVERDDLYLCDKESKPRACIFCACRQECFLVEV